MSAPVHQTESPDFRHVNAWIFDLDHTLYTLDAAQHSGMEERICVFVQKNFGLARDPAFELQKRYLHEYGSTLAGLVRHHDVDPDVYHDAVNDIEALGLLPDADLRAALLRLNGRRVVFTNNCGRYARSVLERLKLEDLFDTIVDARAIDFQSKPHPSAYERLVALGGFVPHQAALFDDSARNLVPAHDLGMTTIWFNNGGGQSHWRVEDFHVDHETDDLPQFLHSIQVAAS